MKIDKALQSAYQHYQAGDLKQASDIYKKILRVKPNNIDAIRFLEMICCQLGDFDDAIGYIKKEIQLTPSNADVYYKLGTVLRAKGLFSGAIDYFRKAITLNPHSPEAYYNLGLALENTGQLDEAILNYQKAVQIEPGLVEAYNNLGILLSAKGRLEEAITHFQKAIRINPNCADIYNNLGLALKDKGNVDEAIINFKKAFILNPALAVAYFNLGVALQDKRQLDEAINFYKKALQINPDLDGAYNNIGDILAGKGHFDEAITYFQKAIALNPNLTGAYYNLGNIFKDKGQPEEAISFYQKALQIDPNYAEAHFNMAFALLLSGSFIQGWKEYEWRWKSKEHYEQNLLQHLSQPLWDGSDISGKTILIHTEQGYGDAIQFIRYAPLLARQVVKVLILCPKELISLFQNVEGIHQVIGGGEYLPSFDIHCPLLSLPLKFNTTLDTIPAEIPYIKVDTALLQKWKDKVKDDTSKFRVGLSWAGRPTHKDNSNRSFPLETFAPLAQSNGVIFYSLQKGKGSEQANNPPVGMRLIDYTNKIQDFSDTAALIENLDLVISVDTAVAHLAGAMGKPVWTLLPFAPDWRWMLNREDSPWYPTMRLFRQPSPGDWKSVINNVRKELEVFIRDENR